MQNTLIIFDLTARLRIKQIDNMEVAALAGLVGIGYAVSRFNEQNIAKPSLNIKNSQRKEGFINTPSTKPSNTQTAYTSLNTTLNSKSNELDNMYNTSLTGNSSDLDLMYNTRGGNILPSEPNVSNYQGLYTNYSTKLPPKPKPIPEPLESQIPMVEMRSDGIEEKSNYLSCDYVVSQLTGQQIPSSEFRHNNMVPFYGGRIKQNMTADMNQSRLDTFTGAGSVQINKKEVESMFDANKPFLKYSGAGDDNVLSDFVQSRINDPRSRNGERPFEPIRVGAGVGEKFGMTGKGGFQQLEVNDIMRTAMKTDELRVASDPKLSYKGVVVPGQHFITNASEGPGEIRKYRPDRFYVDETGERFFVTNGEVIKDTVRSTQILNHTTRPETSREYIGSGKAQDYQEQYVTGSYRDPMTQQFGGAGYRNADMTSYYTENPDAAEADYGRSAYENRPNERSATSERVMGLNLKPAEAGALTVHYDDDTRPTRRAETIGNLRQTGNATGYASGAPAVTVWDPSDVARTTVKETTVDWNYMGMASPASAPTRLKVYDPDDIPRPTQKAQLSNRDYYGTPMSSHQDFTSHDAAHNMRLNPNKQQISKSRKPIAGNGGIAVFTGQVNQTSKKLDSDILNDRANAVNRVNPMSPGAGDLGSVKFRVPLQLDMSLQRNTPDMISALESNPLNQSLKQNAERDNEYLQRMLQSGSRA
jgi:hypothetical protein